MRCALVLRETQRVTGRAHAQERFLAAAAPPFCCENTMSAARPTTRMEKTARLAARGGVSSCTAYTVECSQKLPSRAPTFAHRPRAFAHRPRSFARRPRDVRRTGHDPQQVSCDVGRRADQAGEEVVDAVLLERSAAADRGARWLEPDLPGGRRLSRSMRSRRRALR
jgi:hypothetical protein